MKPLTNLSKADNFLILYSAPFACFVFKTTNQSQIILSTHDKLPIGNSLVTVASPAALFLNRI